MKDQHIRSAEMCFSVNNTTRNTLYIRLDSRITDIICMFVEMIIRHLYSKKRNFPRKRINHYLQMTDL